MDLVASLRWHGDDVVVVGTGAVTAVGTSAPMTAASVRAGIQRHEETPLVDKAGEPMRCALAPLEAPLRAAARMRALAEAAALEALAPLLDADGRGPTVALSVGLPAPRPALDAGVPDALMASLAAALPVPVERSAQAVYPHGRAAGLLAIGEAARQIEARPGAVVLAGGVDSYADPLLLEALDADGRLHSDANVDGFIPGEGAAFCVLTSAATAARHGWTPRARLRSAASGQEPEPRLGDGACLGTGLTQTLQAAFFGLRDDEAADWTLCDLTGESFGAAEWMYAYIRTGHRHADPLEIQHPADCFGDAGAAAGAIGLTLAVEAWARGYARGPRCLLWGASDEAPRSALIVEHAA